MLGPLGSRGGKVKDLSHTIPKQQFHRLEPNQLEDFNAQACAD